MDTARAYIAIKGGSVEKVDGEEFRTISAECCALKEIEEAADWLIKELEAIKKQAKTFFKKEQAKILTV